MWEEWLENVKPVSKYQKQVAKERSVHPFAGANVAGQLSPSFVWLVRDFSLRLDVSKALCVGSSVST